MNLPSSGIRWSEYKITTPTFRLTPVEKPDLSPFLIHMTGKNSLVRVLKGENAGEGINVPVNSGFIRASIPSFDTSKLYYNSPVVCFTESPIFALDFFRYRSFRRWDFDQQYGIGFSKEALIKHRGVRPVIYLDTQTNSEILSICNKSENNEINFSENEAIDATIKASFKKIKPLLFPMLENEPYQGFMWEREWRCPDPNGLIFPYQAIKVICCPASEKAEILGILGELTIKIDVVESWREYDEVTNYLKRRSGVYNVEALNQIDQLSDLLVLRDLKEKNDQTYHALIAYYQVFKETVDSMEGKSISNTIDDLKNTSNKLTQRIEKIMADNKAKEQKKKSE